MSDIDPVPTPDGLAFVSLDVLSPHEEIRQATEARVAALLRRCGEFTWPIIVDRDTGLILDGNHRYAVLRRLGARHVLAQLVAVKSPEVAVGRWCRIFDGVSGTTFEKLRQGHQLAEVFYEGPGFRSAGHALYRYGGRLFAAPAAEDPYQACLGAYRIECELGATPGAPLPTFEDEERAEQVAGQSETLVLYPPVPSKEVVLSETGRRLFPPKSTRFLLPYRLIGVPVPIERLQGKREPLEAILDRSRQVGVTFLARGLRVDRVYPEPLYQFRSYRIPADCFADAAAQREYEARLAERLAHGATR